jgi:hypothetical protein
MRSDAPIPEEFVYGSITDTKQLLFLLLEQHLFPSQDTFEHSPQGEDGSEHEDLLPCAQLDSFEQRCYQFEA